GRRCRAGFAPAPGLYPTPVALDDLDVVRAPLGYEQINLYGGSYGTRAALVYLRRYEARVRSAVLDGVAPTDMRLPLFFARDGQRAFDKLIADCEADAACAAKHPGLAARARHLLARLDRTPPRVRLTHPRTGRAEEVSVEGGFVANILFGVLYSPLASSLIPELVARAEADDFQGLLALALMNEGVGRNMSVGMQLSVICAEDYPRITDDDVAEAAAETLFASRLLASRFKACEFWPKGEVPAGYYEPVVSAVPALVLSGDLDPVTPPTWGDAVTRHLSRARHVVVPATGHGAISTGCGARLVEAFIERGTTDGLDTSCLDVLTRPPFFLTPAGPDPATAPRTPR
ncbi:MAG: alpha/beta hydrolase, partial [Acidobacteriota bacterium]